MRDFVELSSTSKSRLECEWKDYSKFRKKLHSDLDYKEKSNFLFHLKNLRWGRIFSALFALMFISLFLFSFFSGSGVEGLTLESLSTTFGVISGAVTAPFQPLIDMNDLNDVVDEQPVEPPIDEPIEAQIDLSQPEEQDTSVSEQPFVEFPEEEMSTSSDDLQILAVPTQGTPILNSSSGTSNESDNITCYPQSLADGDGDAVYPIFNWWKNGVSQTLVNMPFDLNDSTTTKDYSGNGNDGTITNAIWALSSRGGGSYEFDGNGDYIDTTGTFPTGTAPRTLMTWARFDSFTADKIQVAVSWGLNTHETYKVFSIATFGWAGAGHIAMWGISGDLPSNAVLNAGEWYHVTATYNGTDVMLYINGTLDNTGTIALNTGSDPLQFGRKIGTYTDRQWFDGAVQGTKVFDYALSDEQIYQIFLEEDNSLNTSTIHSEETTLGENWSCQVIPNDLNETGDPANSTILTIGDNLLVNSPPTQGTPILNSTSGTNNESENLTCYPQSFSDANGDAVYPIFNWWKNDVPVAILNMPFDLNDSSEAKDYSGYGSDGNIDSSGPTWTSDGKIGGAYSFSGDRGDDVRISVDNQTSVPLGNEPRTMMGWAITPNFNIGYPQTIVGWGNPIAGQGSYLTADNNKFRFVGISSAYDIQTGADLPGNIWYHVAFTYNGTDGIIYVNGSQYASKSSLTLATTSSNITIGKQSWDDGVLTGKIDDVRVYNYSLSANQINQIYQEGFTGLNTSTIVSDETTLGENWSCQVIPTDLEDDGSPANSTTLTIGISSLNSPPTQGTPILNSTTGANTTNENLTCYPQSLSDANGEAVYPIFNWWKDGTSQTVLNMPFDLNSSTEAKDYSGYGNNGTLQDNTFWNSSGMRSGAYQFDGSGDFINVSHVFGNFSEFTVVFWRKSHGSGTGDYPRMVTAGNIADYASASDGFTFEHSTNSQSIINGGFKEDGNGWSVGSFSVSDNVWYQVAMTFNGTRATLYNGSTVAGSVDRGDFGNVITFNNMQIGGHNPSSRWFNGLIDEVKLYNFSMSQEQIAQLYQEGLNNLNTSTIVSEETTVGENWTCQVIPTDLEDDGSPANSSALEILEAHPTQGTPILNSTTGTNFTSENLTCYPQSLADGDGDAVYPIFNWWKDDAPVALVNMPFDLNDSVTAKDYSGNGIDGTIAGPIWNLSSRFGGSYYFDDAGDDIVISSLSIPSNVDKTFIFWVKPTSLTDSDFLLDSESGRLVLAMRDVGSEDTILFYDGAWKETNVAGDVGVWQHIVFAFEGTIARVYKNGQQIGGDIAYTPKAIGGNTRLGSYFGGSGNTFDGSFGDVKIFNASLSASQIYQLFLEENNSLNTSTIHSDETTIGENWTCQVIPTDLEDAGDPANSSALEVLEIVNAAPNTTKPLIIPTPANPASTLNCTVNYTDFEGTAGNVSFIWFVNDFSVHLENVTSVADNSAASVLLSSSNFSLADTVICSVRAYDGGNYSEWQNSSELTITSPTGLTQGTPILNSTTGADLTSDNLTCYPQSLSDAAYPIFNWWKDDVPIAILNMPFDLNSSIEAKDYSGYGNNGTPHGNTFWSSSGIKGGAYKFDGNGDHINVSHVLGDFTEFTVVFWRKSLGSGTGSWPRMVTSAKLPNYGSTDDGFTFEYKYNAQNLLNVFFSPDGTNHKVVDEYSLSQNTWYQLAMTVNGSKAIVYANSGSIGSADYVPGSVTTLNYMEIGGNTLRNRWFNGLIDEVKLYNISMSPEQIAQLYQEGLEGLNTSTIHSEETTIGESWTCQVIPTDLNETGDPANSSALEILGASNNAPTQGTPILNSTTAENYSSENLTCYPQSFSDVDGDAVYPIFNWWKNDVSDAIFNMPFDLNDSSEAKDYSGYGSDGLIANAVWTSSGKVGGAYSFDGSTANITAVNQTHLPLGNEPRTLMAWIYTGSDVSSDQTFLGWGPTTDTGNTSYLNQQGGKIRFVAIGEPGLEGSANIQTNTWYHVAATHDGTNLIIYVNGSLYASRTTTLSTTYSNIYVGVYGFGSGYFEGTIDEARIYNYSLSAYQVAQIYQEGLDGLNTSTIHSDETTLGENWTCQVIPTDLEDDGSPANSTVLEVLELVVNVAPNTTLPFVIPSTAYTNSTLNCSVNYTDAEGTAGTVEFRWFVNDSSVYLENATSVTNNSAASVLLNSPNFSKGDGVICGARAYDGENYSAWQNSSTLTILNLVPSQGTPLLNSTTAENYSSENLTCYPQSFSDEDGDAVYPIFNWWKNDVPDAIFNMPFDVNESSTAKDYSGYGSDGSITNAVWTSNGKVGGAYTFDGSGDYIIAANQTPLPRGNEERTMMAWVHTGSGVTNDQNIFGWGPTGTSGLASYLNLQGGRFRFVAWGDPSIEGPIGIQTSTWYHVVYTHNTTNSIIYVNGSVYASNTATLSTGLSNNIYIGEFSDGGSQYEGTIDEVKIYNYSMSANQIAQVYQEGLNGLNTSTIHSDETTIGENWTCQVIPTDLEDAGSPVNSTALEVLEIPITAVNITSCPTTLGSENVVYTLLNNITSTGTCIDIDANNITVDCQGYTITGSRVADSAGINVTSVKNNATIKNCKIMNFSSGIFFTLVHEAAVVLNNTLYDNDNGIYLGPSVTASFISSNTIQNNSVKGIWFASASLNNISRNIIEGPESIFLSSSSNSNYFEHNRLSVLENTTYIRVISGVTNKFVNTTFKEGYTELRYPSEITLGSGNIVNNSYMNLTQNKVYLNSTSLTLFNISAEITLENASFTNPRALVDYDDDGNFDLCPAPQCNNLSWDGTTFVFNVSSFTTYSFEDTPSTNITSCPRTLDLANTVYTLQNNITSSGTCIDIDANNITVDCQGYTITGSRVADSAGINVTSIKADATIKNCKIINFSSGIFFTSSNEDAVVLNNTLYDNDDGIYLGPSVTSSFVTSNTLQNNSERGIVIDGYANNISRNILEGQELIVVLSSSNQNYFEHNRLSVLENTTYIRVAVGSTTTFANTTFREGSTDLRYPQEILIQSAGTVVNNSHLNLTQNKVYLNSTLLNPFNVSAEVTLENASFTNPRVLVDYGDDGNFDLCIAPQCNNLSWDGSTFVFNVSSFTTYSFEDTPSTNITSCPRTLDLANTVYTLQNNITSSGTCIDIDANNITVDCQGYTITGSRVAGSAGINVTSIKADATIKNCKIINFSSGIFFTSSNEDAVVLNNTLYDNDDGIYLGPSVTSSFVTSNTLQNNSERGIVIDGYANNISRNILEGQELIVVLSSSNQNYFEHNRLSVLENTTYIRVAIGSDTKFANTTFREGSTDLRYPQEIRIQSAGTVVNNSHLNLTQNKVYLNSTLLNPFNVSAEITLGGLEGLSFIEPQAYVDVGDTGSFSACNATTTPVCNNLSWDGSTFVFNVSHFTSYRVQEGITVPGICGNLDSANTVYTMTRDVSSSETCFNIDADNVTLDCAGFLINGSRASSSYGVNITRSSSTNTNVTIKNCIIENFEYGIESRLGNNNTFFNNTINDSVYYGLRISSGGEHTIVSNRILEGGYGIYLASSSLNQIINNTVQESTWEDLILTANSASECSHKIENMTGSGGRQIGFYNYSVNLENQEFSSLILCDADYSNITNVNVSGSDSLGNNRIHLLAGTASVHIDNVNSSNNLYGVYVGLGCSNNTIENSEFVSSGLEGIYLRTNVRNTTIRNNTISNSISAGILFSAAHGNRVIGNTFFQNNPEIYFSGNAQNNSVYNNLFNNTNYVTAPTPKVNYLNATQQAGTRIFGEGTQIGGNYWTNSSGTGFSDTCADANTNGFCDVAYNLTGNNTDYLALSDEYQIPANIAPTQGTPILNSTTGDNTTNENLICYAQNLDDTEGDQIYLTFNWKVDGNSLTVLNMPFDNNVTNATDAVWDYSGLGNNGSLLGASGAYPQWNTSILVGGAYEFNPYNATRIKVVDDDSLSFVNEEFSMEVWARPGGYTGFTQYMTYKWGTSGSREYGLSIVTSDQVRLILGDGATDTVSADSIGTVNNNVWNHIVATYNGSNIKFYINGSLDNNVGNKVADLVNVGVDFYIGATNTGSSAFNGTLGKVVLYNKTLSDSQVALLYNEATEYFNSSTLTSDLTSAGEEWACEVTPSDLEDVGNMSNSTALEVLGPLNAAPQITQIFVGSSITPEEAGVVNVSVNFTVLDTEGFADVNVSTAAVNFTRGIEPLRENTSCSSGSSSGNYINFTCTVGMWYFDEAGSWNITATVSDESWENATNDTVSFTYESFPAIVMSPASINWFEIVRGSSNQLPDSNLTINHTGNAVISNISVSAVNLTGEQDGNYIIYAENFSVSSNLAAACSGDSLVQDTFVNVTGSSLTRGNLSEGGGTAQEELAYCLTETSADLIKQAYSTALSRAWYIKIIAALAVFTLKTKRKKRVLKALRELREVYGLSPEELVSSAMTLREEERRTIPISLFKSNISPAELVVRYMKEEFDLKLSEIAKVLNRNDRSIWTTYQNASKRREKLIVKKGELEVPVSIFSDRRLSILESLTLHLRKEGLSNVEIAKMLDRDPRNIYTLFKRAGDKLKKKENL
ncbi:LamG-like jellyroll fold domain-containing protein [Nanoarchaeota archaeon]